MGYIVYGPIVQYDGNNNDRSRIKTLRDDGFLWAAKHYGIQVKNSKNAPGKNPGRLRFSNTKYA